MCKRGQDEKIDGRALEEIRGSDAVIGIDGHRQSSLLDENTYTLLGLVVCHKDVHSVRVNHKTLSFYLQNCA